MTDAVTGTVIHGAHDWEGLYIDGELNTRTTPLIHMTSNKQSTTNPSLLVTLKTKQSK